MFKKKFNTIKKGKKLTTVTRNFDKDGNRNHKQKQLIVLIERLLQNNYAPCCQGIIKIQCKMILLTIKTIETIQNFWKLGDLNTVIKLEN